MKARILLYSLFFLALFPGVTGLVHGQETPPPTTQTAPQATIDDTFTYQGRLTDNGVPANGSYNLVFKLYDSPGGSTQIGPAITLTQTISEGLFTVGLNFGSNLFNGDARYLEIQVRPAGTGAYTTLSPRQLLSAAPYALNIRPGARIRGLYGGGVGAGSTGYTNLFHVGSLPFSGNATYEKLLVTVWGGSWYNITLGEDTYAISSRGGLKINRTRLYGSTSAYALKVYSNTTTSSYDVVVAVENQNYPSLGIRSLRLDSNNGYLEQPILSNYDPTGKTEVTPALDNQIIAENDGNIGIGAADPAARLHITADNTQRALYLEGGPTVTSNTLTTKWNLAPNPAAGGRLVAVGGEVRNGAGLGFFVANNVASPFIWMYGSTSNNAFTVARINYSPGEDISGLEADLIPLFQVRGNGNVGLGTVAPAAPLEIYRNDPAIYLNDTGDTSTEVALRANGDNFEIVEIEDTSGVQSSLGGQAWMTFKDSSSPILVGINMTNPQTTLHVSGTARANIVQITGGSDLAELFEITGPRPITAGLVVAIDPQHPGNLRIADRAYDRTVAGCISGANGINPGLVLQQTGTLASGTFPVAVVGRVYCWADAAAGPIRPGDLLTTADRPGHLMRVADYDAARGAIVGKAMTALEQGQGLILVLVTLQ